MLPALPTAVDGHLPAETQAWRRRCSNSAVAVAAAVIAAAVIAAAAALSQAAGLAVPGSSLVCFGKRAVAVAVAVAEAGALL